MNCGKKVRLKPTNKVTAAMRERVSGHDVVEMRDHEVGVVDMNVQAQAGEEQSGEAANQKKSDEAERVEHRRVPGDGAFVKGGGPVEDFDRRGDGHQIAEERKRKCGVSGFAGNKHVVRPDEKTDDRDSDARTGDEGVSEDRLARERGNNLADHAHGRKNHDVYRRMRIEPEKVLKEDGIAAEGGIEKAEMKHALKASEQESDGDNGRAQDHDQAGGVMRPSE